jgi:pyridoxamine 5'-phosphate oxidase family protein
MGFTGFSRDERAWLASQRLGRLATVSPDGVVGNAPVTYFLRADDTIDIGGMRMGATKKFRNVQAGSRVALVVDVVDTSTGWNPIYLEVRGTAEAITGTEPPGDGFSPEIIRIHPTGSGRSTCRPRRVEALRPPASWSACGLRRGDDELGDSASDHHSGPVLISAERSPGTGRHRRRRGGRGHGRLDGRCRSRWRPTRCGAAFRRQRTEGYRVRLDDGVGRPVRRVGRHDPAARERGDRAVRNVSTAAFSARPARPSSRQRRQFWPGPATRERAPRHSAPRKNFDLRVASVEASTRPPLDDGRGTAQRCEGVADPARQARTKARPADLP